MNKKILFALLFVAVGAALLVTASALTPKETEVQFIAALVDSGTLSEKQATELHTQVQYYQQNPQEFQNLLLEIAAMNKQAQNKKIPSEDRDAVSE